MKNQSNDTEVITNAKQQSFTKYTKEDLQSLCFHHSDFSKALHTVEPEFLMNRGEVTNDNIFNNDFVDITEDNLKDYVSSLSLNFLIGFYELLKSMDKGLLLSVESIPTPLGEIIEIEISGECYKFKVKNDGEFVGVLIEGYVEGSFQVHVDADELLMDLF